MIDWKEKVPLVHYSNIYKTLDPSEIAARCNLIFDDVKKTFSLCLMGVEYQITHPEFSMKSLVSIKPLDGGKEVFVSDAETKVLVLRFLCEGHARASSGKQLSYREIPWGEVYFKNFEGRCIKRVERTFGECIENFCKIFSENKNLKATPLEGKKSGFRFEFLSGLYMSIIIWEGDDEFPASAQILFDDNFPAAFTAEDIAAVGDVSITALKNMLGKSI
ncbi:MAG: DUF3786 domain-containing protein [Termitinemataceae bacterium]|nr:MAG: DUF3786 domain-containing protein [Termitinemataceae bacterium]